VKPTPSDHPETLNALTELAETHAARGDWDKALPCYQEALQRRREKLGDERPQTLDAMVALGQALGKSGRHAEAEAILSQLLSICQRTMPDDWSTFQTRILLGRVLVDLERFEEAEPMLLDGYNGLEVRIQQIPPDCLEGARSELVKLYEAWAKPDQAARWRGLGTEY
jgi:tetratricopeptide (TPR) repeat protein